jgi:hypothetical protein
MRGWFRVIWAVLDTSRNAFPAIIAAPLCTPPFAFEHGATTATVPGCANCFSVSAFPVAPHSRVTSTREADRPDALAARITNLCNVGAVLFEELVSLARGELHFGLLLSFSLSRRSSQQSKHAPRKRSHQHVSELWRIMFLPRGLPRSVDTIFARSRREAAV